jgi:DNA-binding Xre family transcriptional regulator
VYNEVGEMPQQRRRIVRLQVRELAAERGVNMSQLQRQTGLTMGMIRRYWYNEGKGQPLDGIQLSALARIADVLGVRSGDLIYDEMEPATKNEVIRDERDEPVRVKLMPDSVPVLSRNDEVRSPREIWANVEFGEPTAYFMDVDRYEELLIDRINEGIARELSDDEYVTREQLDPVFLFPSVGAAGSLFGRLYYIPEWEGPSDEDEDEEEDDEADE